MSDEIAFITMAVISLVIISNLVFFMFVDEIKQFLKKDKSKHNVTSDVLHEGGGNSYWCS